MTTAKPTAMTPSPNYDFGILIGVLAEPITRQIRFDGTVALFADGAYCFVQQRLSEFACPHVPPAFFDCYGGCALTDSGAEELGWFANALRLALADYPERWDVDVGGRLAQVEREGLRQQLVVLGETVQRARAEGRTVASLGD